MFLTLSYINSGLNFKPLRTYRAISGAAAGVSQRTRPQSGGRAGGPHYSM
jgi:hypothetical protein